MQVVHILFMFMFIICLSKCARIFGIFPVPSISHQKVYQPIYTELSRRGHEVIVVTPNPFKDSSLSNLTEIDVGYLYDYSSFIKDEMGGNFPTTTYKTAQWVDYLIEHILDDKRLKVIYMNPKEKFDAVLVEHYTPLLHAFGIIFKVPVIGVTSTGALLGTHMALGNPIHPVLFADAFLSVSERSMSEKIWRSFCFLWSKWHYEYVVYPRGNGIVRKYFGNNRTDLRTADIETSMLLVNTNHFISPVRPMGPNVVTLGFMHIEYGILPQDLQEIMDKATEGVIYMSLGSNVKSSTLPPKLIQTITQTLSNLPYTVLWKWEAGNIIGIGRNVVTRKWFPQQDVLAHPNIKVFVTQGGLQSIEEAISRAVPMVGLPFVADQVSNVDRLDELGIGLKLNPEILTEEKFGNAILKVAQDSKYLENIKKIRDLALDQPMTGLERAVWWTEYVIRHKGANHLRSVVATTPLWEYLILDVIAVVLIFFVISAFLMCKLLGLILRALKSLYVFKDKLA